MLDKLPFIGMRSSKKSFPSKFLHNFCGVFINTVCFKFFREFEIVLKNIKWPNLGQVQEVFSPSKDSINKLTSFAEYMFLVQLPGYDRFMYVKITPSIICPPISTPIELLVKPFKQRFDYHFMGVRQTNRIDKPEWYFTQILNWAKENHIFVGEIFQSAANRACITENTRVRFFSMFKKYFLTSYLL